MSWWYWSKICYLWTTLLQQYLNESFSLECSPLSYLLLVRCIWPRVLLLLLTMTGMEFRDMLSKTPCLFMPKSILSNVPFDAEVFRLFLVMWLLILLLLLLLLLDTDWKLISESSSDGAMIVTPLDGSSSIGNPPSKWSPLLAAWKETLPNVTFLYSLLVLFSVFQPFCSGHPSGL
jgi:hypothetical protein